MLQLELSKKSMAVIGGSKHKRNMIKIIGLFPLTGNGGISSWTKKFVKTFPDNEYVFSFVNVAPERPRTGDVEPILYRASSGLAALRRIIKELKSLLKSGEYQILHSTTSGDIGAFRDICVFQLCHKYGVKTVMHCRYGCIPENIKKRGLVCYLTRKSMSISDQIWVLDSRSYKSLSEIPAYKDKVFLVPNSIDVQEKIDSKPKSYKTIAFCGNLVPSKGLYELVEAATRTDVILHIVGPGTDVVNERIRRIAGEKLDKTIFLHGKLPNTEAVQFMKTVDIVALPTYYPSEAFPISIVEAMSLSKMVISCPRAAISDMLTSLDGSSCGLLVKPKSSEVIVDAINWCQSHMSEADEMCRKAYEKVYSAYRMDIVYELYRKNYDKLINS